jgi:hypothetical protein
VVLKGKAETMFSIKLEKNLGHGVIGGGCAGYSFQNTVRAATDTLPVDEEMIVSKIYPYYKSSTVRFETLDGVL